MTGRYTGIVGARDGETLQCSCLLQAGTLVGCPVKLHRAAYTAVRAPLRPDPKRLPASVARLGAPTSENGSSAPCPVLHARRTATPYDQCSIHYFLTELQNYKLTELQDNPVKQRRGSLRRAAGVASMADTRSAGPSANRISSGRHREGIRGYRIWILQTARWATPTRITTPSSSRPEGVPVAPAAGKRGDRT